MCVPAATTNPSDASRSIIRCRSRSIVGVVEALPFPDASFDLVASTTTVCFWLDLARAFSELHRVLRPGGLLTVGFSGAAKLRRFGAITQHGFRFHENAALIEAASAAGSSTFASWSCTGA